LAKRPLRTEKEGELDAIRRRDDEHQAKILRECDWFSGPIPEPQPTYGQVASEFSEKELQIIDPTSLVLIDEADRLRMASLEQVRAIFDAGEIGVILIGMPGLEKNRHATRSSTPVSASSTSFGHWPPRRFANCWTGVGRHPASVFHSSRWTRKQWRQSSESRGGNFRLLNCLLTQIERILGINALEEVTKTVVEAARRASLSDSPIKGRSLVYDGWLLSYWMPS
jgi:hypothetical protein